MEQHPLIFIYHGDIQALPLSFSMSVYVRLTLPPPDPHLFLDGDIGDPDVTFHWPMERREGLDWCALLVPFLLKRLLSPAQPLNFT